MNVLKENVWLESVITAQSTLLGLFSMDLIDLNKKERGREQKLLELYLLICS